jgi:hypothetical protein
MQERSRKLMGFFFVQHEAPEKMGQSLADQMEKKT